MSPQDEAEWDEIGNRLERSIRTMSNEKRETTALAVMAPQDVRAVAESVAKSGLFKGFERPDAAFALMMLCQAEGLHPIVAVRRYDVIQGRPAMKADAMLADFLKAGGEVEWHELSGEKVSASFSGPGCKKPVTITWTIEDARRAGLANKDNWKNFPRAMLRSRVVSEGVRTVMPGVVAGVHSPEEVMDFDAPPPPPTYIPPPETQAKLAAVSAASRESSKGFADGNARAHREAPGHSPKAPPAPSAAAPSTPTTTAKSVGSSSATATSASAAAASSATSTAQASPASDLPKEADAPSATSPSSTPSGAQDANPPSEREPGSDDDVEVSNSDLVTCKHFGRDGRVIRETTEPRRSEEQSRKMFALFNSRRISEQDTPDPKNPAVSVKGWRSRIKDRFGKDSTKDLSVRECSFLIDQMERWNSRHGDAAAKEQKYRENGFQQRQDGSWGDGGAA